MKRSEINRLICQAKEFFARHHFQMPPFAHWTPADWQRVGSEADEIRQCHLGWDLTDFGSGDFHKVGLLLFTIRNGHPSLRKKGKAYAEKIMIVGPEQVTPWHHHKAKMEDIINRGGGRLVMEVRQADAAGQPTNEDVTVSTDGVRRTVPANSTIVLSPGESITIPRQLIHQFYGEKNGPPVLVGEVSDVNDDATDNYFSSPVGRFPDIVEDEPPVHLLCTEYPVFP